MRKYLPTLGELIDRLTIVQLKEVKIPQHKEEYQQEIKDIVHDINQILLDEKLQRDIVDGEMIRAIIVKCWRTFYNINFSVSSSGTRGTNHRNTCCI